MCGRLSCNEFSSQSVIAKLNRIVVCFSDAFLFGNINVSSISK